MIAYPILAAQQSNLFDHIIVSTDDPAIKEVALSYKASVPFLRPATLSDDFTGTTPVITHALEEMIAQGVFPQHVCCIYATTPFLHPLYLQQGLELLQNGDKEYAFSVTSFSYPIFRSLRKEGNGVEMVCPEYRATRSQDLPETFHDAGQFYWGRTSAWREGKTIFSPHSAPVVLPRHLVQDIDTPEDWERAQLMYNAYMRS
jgi:N-acylneuraminate cytidylyltransferase